jgi:hypothetical protein
MHTVSSICNADCTSASHLPVRSRAELLKQHGPKLDQPNPGPYITLWHRASRPLSPSDSICTMLATSCQILRTVICQSTWGEPPCIVNFSVEPSVPTTRLPALFTCCPVLSASLQFILPRPCALTTPSRRCSLNVCTITYVYLFLLSFSYVPLFPLSEAKSTPRCSSTMLLQHCLPSPTSSPMA